MTAYTLRPATLSVLALLRELERGRIEHLNGSMIYNERTTEGDSVDAIESRRLGAWDHPPAPGRSASSRVIR